jgi:hypothetical protein
MGAQIATGRRAEIGLSAAAYLEMGLAAMREGDTVRAIAALASIDADAWEAISVRFPHLDDLIQKWGAS